MPDAIPASRLFSAVDVMPFEIACPSCGQKLIADEVMRGQSVNCPACKNFMSVEKPAEPPSADEDDFGLTEKVGPGPAGDGGAGEGEAPTPAPGPALDGDSGGTSGDDAGQGEAPAPPSVPVPA